MKVLLRSFHNKHSAKRLRRKDNPIMEMKTSLKVFHEADIPAGQGIVSGQIRKRLAGSADHPSDPIMAILATFQAGTLEPLHWHLVEAFHYVISGRAIVRDIEGHVYEVGPGSVIYIPAGITGSHEWDIQEQLQLIAFRATTDSERSLQITVDPSTKQSKIELEQLADDLIVGGAVNFKKSLY
jgi:mannose-6-phosphate isomerase-like protein (cupin superfamily)